MSSPHFYGPVVPIIRDGLQQCQTDQIIDLCSGSGGPAVQVLSGLEQQGTIAQMTLTDNFPNPQAWQMLQDKNPNIRFVETSVDATNRALGLQGFRTVFLAVHHLDEKTITAILKNAAQNNSGIGIFDGGDKNIWTILGILLVHPLLFFFLTPFFRPFRLSRILFTYLIPIIPFCTIWDGVVSILRLYHPDKLLAIARNFKIPNYDRRAGRQRNRFGMRVTYLIGYPKTPNDATQRLS